MRTHTRVAALLATLTLGTLLAGCPGMPGAAGTKQTMPPGVLPPPGLESGGARTIMGTTVTPPDDSYLLVKLVYAGESAPAEGEWQSCRRIMFLDANVMVEGLNYDARAQDAPKDENKLVPLSKLADFQWKYEARPVPPAGQEPAEKPKSSK